MIGQTAVMKRHNWTPALTGAQLDGFRYTTTWTYDDLGRIATVGFPDSKSVSFLPDSVVVGTLTSQAQVTALLQTAALPGETATYDYDSGGLLRSIGGAEQGTRQVPEQLAPDALGVVRTVNVPRRTTHDYTYLQDRVYDPRLLAVRDTMGNGTASSYVFDPDTWWLTDLDTTGPRRAGAPGPHLHLRRGRSPEDDAQRPAQRQPGDQRWRRAFQEYEYDGFGRIVGASRHLHHQGR